MERNFYTTPKPSKLMQLFWKAAGADKYILERSTYSDQIKYTCMGGIVVATGVMAALAGGYAFYTILEPKGSALDSIVLKDHAVQWSDTLSMNAIQIKEFKQQYFASIDAEKTSYIHYPTVLLSLIFGLIWGLIIFNIDRFIVTSTGKGDGTEAITAGELKSALPRIIMGTIIALTISKPVEIRMFKTEIDIKLHEEQLQQQAEYKKKVEANLKPFSEAAQKDIDKLQKEISDKTKLRDDIQDQLNKEIQGKVGSGREGEGPASKSIRANLDRIQAELDAVKTKNTDLINQKMREKQEYDDKIKIELSKTEQVAAGLDGLLERIRICHRPDVAGGMISLFITLLFMAIELTPIFFKLMLIKGPYDYIEENIKELVKAENGIQIQYNYYKDKQGQERDLVIHHQVEKHINDKIKILEAQRELSDAAIEKWKKQQKDKMDGNLGDFIKEG